MNDDGVEFRFIIDTDKPLSMERIGQYIVQFAKLLGVPASLIRIEQDAHETATSHPRTDNPDKNETVTK